MKNTFKRNLLIGFSASLLILMLSSVASYISIQNLLQSADLVTHTNHVIKELRNIRQAMVDAETGQRGFLLTGGEDFLNPYKDARTRALTSFEKVRALTLDNTEQQTTLKELLDQINERFEYLDISIDSKRDGRAILTENLRRGREFMDQVRDMLDIIEERENNLLNERTATLNTFAWYTPPLIITAAIIAFIITILFYVRVRRDFEERLILQQELVAKDEQTSKRINIIQDIAEKISEGSYAVRVDDTQSDALGSVAGSLNKMAGSLEYSFALLSDKEWHQTGLAKLNDAMIGDKTLKSLAKSVVDHLTTYTNGQTGALYIMERNELQVEAGYAYSPQAGRAVFKLGEGLIGQAVVEGKYIELKEIPEDSIYISFVSGQARPKHVVAVPIFDGYTIKGAFELASLTHFSKRDIDFLNSAAGNIGLAITTAQNRETSSGPARGNAGTK